MKKFKILLISLFAVFAFVSCDGGEDTSSSVDETSISEIVSTEDKSEYISEKYSEVVVSTPEVSSQETVVSTPEVSENVSVTEVTSTDNQTSEDIIDGVNVGQTGEGDIIDWGN